MPHETEPDTPVDVDDLYFEDTEAAFNALLTRQQRLTRHLLLLKELHDDLADLDCEGAAILRANQDTLGVLVSATVTVTRMEGKARVLLEKYEWLDNEIEYDRENNWFTIELVIRLDHGKHEDGACDTSL